MLTENAPNTMWNGIVSEQLMESYEPLRVIGHGAFGMVLHARHRRTGDQVAIKRVQTKGGDRRKFYSELKLLLSLTHPHVVRCVDLCDGGGDSSELVLEFADQGSVREYLFERKRFSEIEALDVFIQVSRGIAHAHSEGVLHRDIKPENILGFKGGSRTIYKMGDFGIAKLLGELQVSITSIGTPAYMAPEQFHDEYDYSSDAYALGIILYEMLHGTVPFSGSPSSVFRQHLDAPITVSETVSPELADLIARLVEKDRRSRPSVSDALETALTIRRKKGQRDTDFSPPKVTAQVSKSLGDVEKSADSLFGNMFGVEEALEEEQSSPSEESVSLDDTLIEPENELGTQEPSIPEPDSSRNGNSFFEEGFEDAAKANIIIPQNISGIVRTSVQKIGTISVRRAWSRLIDPRSLGIANPDDGHPLLVAHSNGFYEVSATGFKGRSVYTGPVSSIGTASAGVVPFIGDNAVRVMESRVVLDKVWEFDGELGSVAISPLRDVFAITVGSRVFCHDWDGTQRWVGRFDNATAAPYICYDDMGRLMVVCCNSADQAVHFYGPEGHLIGEQFLPGKIIVAARCRGAQGAWVQVARRSGLELHRVSLEGSMAICQLDSVLSSIVGAQQWVCGLDSDQHVVVIDPATGTSVVQLSEGTVLGIERGANQSEIYVVEERQEVLRYLTCYVVEGKESPSTSQEDLAQ